MQKILVTGMAGFIASEVTRQLLELGNDVVGVDNFCDYYDKRLKHHRLAELNKRYDFSFIEMSIEDPVAVENVFREHKFGLVYNLAARAGVGASLAKPAGYFRTNLLGTLNILQSMVAHNVPKMILASTSSVYSGETLPFREDAAVNRPISPYAASKKAAEQIAFTYNYHYGTSTTVLRFFTVYGPAGRPDMSIFRFIRWIDEGRPIEMFGDGQQCRDFTFVDDIARGALLAAKIPNYEIVNLGGGRTPVSMLRVIELLEKGLGKKAKIDFKPALKVDMKDTSADITKAKALLHWQPSVDIEEGLQRTLDWYYRHRDFALTIRL